MQAMELRQRLDAMHYSEACVVGHWSCGKHHYIQFTTELEGLFLEPILELLQGFKWHYSEKGSIIVEIDE